MGYESLRRDDLAAALDARVDDTVDGSSAFLGRTEEVGSYPAAPARVFAVRPMDVESAEVEGAAAAFYETEADGRRYAYNIGSAIPPTYTIVLVQAVGGRYVFRYDG